MPDFLLYGAVATLLMMLGTNEVVLRWSPELELFAIAVLAFGILGVSLGFGMVDKGNYWGLAIMGFSALMAIAVLRVGNPKLRILLLIPLIGTVYVGIWQMVP